MKLPDSMPMESGSFLTIKEPWRTEWEIGVQVSYVVVILEMDTCVQYILPPIAVSPAFLFLSEVSSICTSLSNHVQMFQLDKGG